MMQKVQQIIELSEQERTVLQVLAEKRLISPSQLAAETFVLPGDMHKMLRSLEQRGLVQIREDASSADYHLVALTIQSRELLT